MKNFSKSFLLMIFFLFYGQSNCFLPHQIPGYAHLSYYAYVYKIPKMVISKISMSMAYFFNRFIFPTRNVTKEKPKTKINNFKNDHAHKNIYGRWPQLTKTYVNSLSNWYKKIFFHKKRIPIEKPSTQSQTDGAEPYQPALQLPVTESISGQPFVNQAQPIEVLPFESKLGKEKEPEQALQWADVFSYGNAQGTLLSSIQEWVKLIKAKHNLTQADLTERFDGGYVFLGQGKKGNLFRGVRNERDDDLKNAYNRRGKAHLSTSVKEIIERLVANYKIHLMPQSLKDCKKVIKKIVSMAKKDPRLQEAIAWIKVYADINFEGSHIDIGQDLKRKSRVGTLPILVIYPSSGKEYAQYVLDCIYKRFGTMEGLGCAGIRPEFNEQITSLIFCAQGDRDLKINFSEWFATKNQVYYSDDLEGEPKNYALRNPAIENSNGNKNGELLDSFIML